MDNTQIVTALRKLMPNEFQVNVPMTKHTSFRIGGPADILVMPSSLDNLVAALQLARDTATPLTVIGNGSNLLVLDKGIRGMVLKLGGSLKEVVLGGTTIHAQAGVLLGSLAAQCAQNGLSGLEFAAGIPGTLGGAVVMNAGAYDGEMKDVLVAVTALTPEGKFVRFTNAELDLSYRHSIFQTTPYQDYIITSVELELTTKPVDMIKARIEDYTNRRLTKQPLDLPSGGSMFKRPKGYYAAALIEEAGLKGFRIGGAEVSMKHAGFVVNVGAATAQDVLNLIKAVKEKVYAYKKVELEPEVRIIGEA